MILQNLAGTLSMTFPNCSFYGTASLYTLEISCQPIRNQNKIDIISNLKGGKIARRSALT